MNARNLKTAEWSLATAGVAFGAFNAFVPNAQELRERCRQPDAGQYLSDVRSGYLSAALLTGLTSLGVGLIVGSPWPVLSGALGAIGMTTLYESHVPTHLRLLGGGGDLLSDPNVIDGQFRRLDE